MFNTKIRPEEWRSFMFDAAIPRSRQCFSRVPSRVLDIGVRHICLGFHGLTPLRRVCRKRWVGRKCVLVETTMQHVCMLLAFAACSVCK